jgi:hypothetical protein
MNSAAPREKIKGALGPLSLLGIALALASCATTGRPAGKPIEGLALLSPEALAYAELKSPSLARFAPLLAPQGLAGAAGSLPSAVARARSASVALLPAGFEAVIEGDYPAFSTRLALSLSKDFSRHGPFYINAKTGMELSMPRANLILAARGGLAPLAARAGATAAANASPIPARFAELSRREILLYAPRPFEKLASALIGESLEVPVSGLLIAAKPLPGEGDRYEASVAFLMDKEGDARVYKPIVRLAWLALARSLFPGSGADFASPRFEEEGVDLVAPALALSGADIEGALRGIAAKMQALDSKPTQETSGQ